MELLSDTLGLNTIITQAREDNVGTFSADISAEEMDTGRRIIIENQFGYSDHDHLGKIITYAAGKDASTIIWIVENARAEHASAIEWLNNNMMDKGFFLVEMDVVRIGDSLPAPSFKIIQKPNAYIQSIKAEMDSDSTKKFKFTYWSQFLDHLKDDRQFLKAYPGTESRRPSNEHWFTFMKGCNGFHVNCNVFTRNGCLLAIGADIVISDDKDLYWQFHSHIDEIHEALGYEMEWSCKDNNKSCTIRIKRDVVDGESLESTFEWLADKAINLRRVFNGDF